MLKSNNIYILLFLVFLSNSLFAIIGSNEYISPSFDMMGNCENSGMQETSIARDTKSSCFINPAALGTLSNSEFEFTHFNYLSGLYRSDEMFFSLPGLKKYSVMFGFKWLDFGKYYDTRNMENDAIFVDGFKTTDSMQYWNDNLAIKRNANEFLLKTVINRKVGKRLSIGTAINVLYRDIEIANYIGSSIDIGAIYDANSQLNLACVIKNLGASAIKEIGNENLSYQPLLLKFGIEYKMPILENENKYLSINVSHNNLLDFKSSAAIGGYLHLNKFINFWGAYSLDSFLNDNETMSPISFGFSLAPKPFVIKYSQKWDKENMLVRTFGVNIKFK